MRVKSKKEEKKEKDRHLRALRSSISRKKKRRAEKRGEGEGEEKGTARREFSSSFSTRIKAFREGKRIIPEKEKRGEKGKKGEDRQSPSVQTLPAGGQPGSGRKREKIEGKKRENLSFSFLFLPSFDRYPDAATWEKKGKDKRGKVGGKTKRYESRPGHVVPIIPSFRG